MRAGRQARPYRCPELAGRIDAPGAVASGASAQLVVDFTERTGVLLSASECPIRLPYSRRPRIAAHLDRCASTVAATTDRNWENYRAPIHINEPATRAGRRDGGVARQSQRRPRAG